VGLNHYCQCEKKYPGKGTWINLEGHPLATSAEVVWLKEIKNCLHCSACGHPIREHCEHCGAKQQQN